jgi:GH24 family phage-related lysozyme (muramidase)
VALRPAQRAKVVTSNPVASFAEGLVPGLQAAIQKFSQAAQGTDQIEHEKKVMAARIENAETLNSFRREVQENKAAVLEAIQTGDYSNLSFDAQKFIDRKVIRDNVHSMVGQAQAYEDLPGLQETINGIDDPMVLADAVRKFISKSTEGVQSDFYATAYGETLMAAGRKMIAGRQAAIAKTGAAKTAQTIRGNLQNDLLNPGNTWDIDGLVSAADTTTAQLIAGGYSPEEAALLAPEMVDKAVIANIGKRPDLLGLVNAPDPTREMTSIMDRYPGAVQEAVDQNVADERALMRADGHRELNTLNRAITTYGTHLQTMTMEEMFGKLYEVRQEYGWESAEYQSTEARLLKSQSAYLKDQTDISMFMNGVMSPMTDKDYNKSADAAYRSLALMTPEQQLNTISVLAEHGIAGDLRQRLQRMLKGTPEQAEEATVFIQALRDASESGDYDDYLDTLPASKLKADEYLTESGMQPSAVAKDVDDITDKMDPWSYYDTTQTTTKSGGRGVGVQEGGRGAHNLAINVWDNYNDQWGTNDAEDWDKLPQNIRRLFKDAVNLAAYHLRDVPHDRENIEQLAQKIAEGQITYTHSLDDGMVPQQRVGSTTPRANNPRHMEAMREQQGRFEIDATAYNAGNEELPDVVATRKDTGYRMGRGELVMLDHGDGVPVPGYYAAGKGYTITLPEVLIPEALKHLMQPVDTSVEGVFHGYLKEGYDGELIDLGDGMRMIYNEERSSWEQRWMPAPEAGPGVGIEDIAGGTIMGHEPDPTQETILTTMRKTRNDLVRRQLEQKLKAGTIDEEQYNQIMEKVGGGRPAEDEAVTPPQSDEEFLKDMHEAIKKGEDDQFEKTSDRPGGSQGSLITQAGNFITKGEGVRTQAYDDYTGRSIHPGANVRGNPTIGHGFNLNRKDAKEKLASMGYDYDLVRSGRQRISEADGIKLRNIVIQEELNWLNRKLKRNKVDTSYLTNNQWSAMLSMSYNGRSLITNHLLAALRNKDMVAAVAAIKDAKGGAWSRLPEPVKVGLKARRKKEANLFRGI